MSDHPSSKPRAPLRLDRPHPLLSASVDAVDGARFLLPVAVAGLLAAAALAVVGLPPVDLHGPLHHLGVMDPFCGGTRALRLTARGDLIGAWRWNPLSPLLAAGAAAYLTRTGVGLATGRWLNLRVATDRRLWIPLLLAIGTLEIRQQALAPILMRHGY